MTRRHALLSDRGALRENNEDHALALSERGLYVIADGMGGHIAGEVASEVAVSSFIACVEGRARPRRIRDEKQILQEAAFVANQEVLQEAARRELFGMGTTLTGLLIRGRTATIAHVGDTRAYFVREKEFRAVTKDQTMVALMVESGVLREDEVEGHPERHVLTQALGTQETVDPEVLQARIPRGARILLSTDGLHDVVPADVIHALALEPDLDAIPRRLVDAAIQRGGPDNVTVILIEP